MDRRCPACHAIDFRALFEHRDRLHGLGGTFTVIQCGTCGVVSYEPLPDDEKLASYYPADYYTHRPPDEAGSSGGFRRKLDDLHLGLYRNLPFAIFLSPLLWYKEVYSYARFLRPIAPRGRGGPSLRLLDIGCGDGAFLLKARRMGFVVEGVEPGGGPAAEHLKAAGVPVFTGRIEALENRAGAFDVITLNHVFEHLSDPEGVLRMLESLLAPGGRVLVRMPRTDHVFFSAMAAPLVSPGNATACLSVHAEEFRRDGATTRVEHRRRRRRVYTDPFAAFH